MNKDTWGKWMRHAMQRHIVLLADGSTAQLHAVRRASRSCKIRSYTRHYTCWIEDIVAVSEVSEEQADIEWEVLEPWQVMDLEEYDREVTLRTRNSAPSKCWLTVVPNRELIDRLLSCTASS